MTVALIVSFLSHNKCSHNACLFSLILSYTAEGYLSCRVWKMAHFSHNLFHCVNRCGQLVHVELASSSVAARSSHDFCE